MDQNQEPGGEAGRDPIQPFDQNADSEVKFTETRYLGIWDIVALVVNKMIGTGIYYTPAQVLVLVGSKWGALLIWLFGVIYTYVSAIVYLEYGTKWPYNGGEFTYLLKILPRPNLIFSTAYAYFFVLLSNSSSNSLIFSIYAVSNGKSVEGKEYVYKITAFLIVLVISVIHLLLKGFGLDLNLFLAGFKTLLLGLAVIIGLIGFLAHGFGLDAGFRDFGHVEEGSGVGGAASVVVAIILVLYAFQGWENANYVTAEIEGSPERQKKTLKQGVLIAITIVSGLYFLFNVVVFLLLDYKTLVRYTNYVSVFHGVFQKVFHLSDGDPIPGNAQTTRAVAACIAMSAAGNLIGTVYTNARVKREIARYQLVPFSSFFAKSSHIGETQDEEGTPTGGLILNCLTSWIVILATPIYEESTEGISFLILLFTYGHSLLGIVLGLAFFDLERKSRQIDISQENLILPGTEDTDKKDSGCDRWAFGPLRNKLARIIVGGLLFAGMNALIFVLPWSNRPSTDVTGVPRKIPIRYVCYITIACYVLGILAAFYILLFAKQMVFFGPQGPLAQDRTASDKFAYPIITRLPDPLEVLKAEYMGVNRVAVPKDDKNFRVLDDNKGYYVREKNRRWILLFDDLGLESFLSVPWKAKGAMVVSPWASLVDVKAWDHGFERVNRLWHRLWRRGEIGLPERVRADIIKAQRLRDGDPGLNGSRTSGGADAVGEPRGRSNLFSTLSGSGSTPPRNSLAISTHQPHTEV